MQAGWLTEVVCQWVKVDWLRRDPVAVLALGQKVSQGLTLHPNPQSYGGAGTGAGDRSHSHYLPLATTT